MKKNSDGSMETGKTVAGAAARPKKNVFREYAESIIIAIILALIIRAFLVQAFKIPSGSMEDTLLIGDHLLVNKFIYGTRIPFTDKWVLPLRQPERGDIIVFEYPEDTRNPDLHFWQRKDYIKRVIGLPGDRVKMVNQVVYVNDRPYTIPQEVHKGLSFDSAPPELFNFKEITVPGDSYFVLGDNRDRSQDSRFWGFVPKDNIKGLAFILYWSWDGDGSRVRWDRIGDLIK